MFAKEQLLGGDAGLRVGLALVVEIDSEIFLLASRLDHRVLCVTTFLIPAYLPEHHYLVAACALW